MTIGKPDDMVQQEILQAGLRLYRKYGPAKVTMDEVANATGRSRTSLYYYYKNRDELFQAVVDSIADEVIKEIRRTVAEAESNIHAKIYAFCSAKIKTSNTWRNVFNTLLIAMDAEEKTKHDRMKSTLHKKLMHNEGIIIKEVLAEAMNKKEIRPVDSIEQDTLAFIICSSVRGIKSEIQEKNDPHNMEEALRLLSDVMAKWVVV